MRSRDVNRRNGWARRMLVAALPGLAAIALIGGVRTDNDAPERAPTPAAARGGKGFPAPAFPGTVVPGRGAAPQPTRPGSSSGGAAPAAISGVRW